MIEDTVLTPIQLECLINFHWNPDAVGEYQAVTIKELIGMFLLVPTNGGNIIITKRGTLHVNHLCSIKLPVRRWVIK